MRTRIPTTWRNKKLRVRSREAASECTLRREPWEKWNVDEPQRGERSVLTHTRSTVPQSRETDLPSLSSHVSHQRRETKSTGFELISRLETETTVPVWDCCLQRAENTRLNIWPKLAPGLLTILRKRVSTYLHTAVAARTIQHAAWLYRRPSSVTPRST